MGGSAMMRMVIKRLLALPVILLCTAVIVFCLAWASPYDPAEVYVMSYGPGVSKELKEQYSRIWGLDRSMPEQFVGWLGQAVRGDLGKSRLLAGQPVAEVIAERAGPSLMLVGFSLLIVLVGGLCCGILAAAYRDSWLDWIIRTSSYFGVFAPSFWVALLALSLFAVHLQWLPAGGAGDLRSLGGPRFGLEYAILPVVTLAITQHGWFTLYVRNTMLEVLREDYVRYAKAQGLSRSRILVGHVLPNALIPFVTLIGTHIPELIGGSVLIENIFGWPGLGSLTREAAVAVDIPLLMAIILLGAVLVVIGNLLSDVLYQMIDPRVRESLR